MKSKKYIVTGEEQFGFPSGSHEPVLSTIWNIERLPCVEYSTSIESMSDREIYWFGLYALEPTNIFNKKSGEIRTVSYMTSRIWITSDSTDFVKLTKEIYPIYDINNHYIGYVNYGITYYTSLYKAHGNKYCAWVIDNRKILFILMIYIILLVSVLK